MQTKTATKQHPTQPFRHNRRKFTCADPDETSLDCLPTRSASNKQNISHSKMSLGLIRRTNTQQRSRKIFFTIIFLSSSNRAMISPTGRTLVTSSSDKDTKETLQTVCSFLWCCRKSQTGMTVFPHTENKSTFPHLGVVRLLEQLWWDRFLSVSAANVLSLRGAVLSLDLQPLDSLPLRRLLSVLQTARLETRASLGKGRGVVLWD